MLKLIGLVLVSPAPPFVDNLGNLEGQSVIFLAEVKIELSIFVFVGNVDLARPEVLGVPRAKPRCAPHFPQPLMRSFSEKCAKTD